MPRIDRLPTRVAAAVLLTTAALPASAQSVEDFYKNKNIDLVIGYSPGGGYDAYARLIARHMGRFIPGKPNLVPRNMPGAGSIVAAAYVYNVAPKDGTVLATVDQSIALQQAMNDPSIKFDTGKFFWIGNPAMENNTVVTWHTSGIKTIEEAKKSVVAMGSTGSIGTSTQYILSMNALIGTQFKAVVGYPGGNDVNLAMEKGEVQGRGSNSWGSWKATRADWLRDKKINIIAQIGLRKATDLQDVPLLMDLTTDPEVKAALKLLSAPTAVGRPIFTTPNVPAERVKALRTAFDAMIKDEQFRAEAEKSGLELDPLSGEEVQKVIEDILATPKPIVARLVEAVKPEHSK